MSTIRRVVEQGFCILTLLLLSGALLHVLRPNEDVLQGDPVAQMMWAGIYVIGSSLILLQWKRALYLATRNKLLLALVGIALLSILWSAAPEVTLRRNIALVGTTLFGVYFATRYSLNEQLRLLAWAVGIAALLSLLFALVLPSSGISSDPLTAGNWQGIYAHKNTLGRNMALGFMIFFILGVSGGKYRWLAWAFCGLSFILLLLSNSLTSLFISLTFLILWPLYKLLRSPYTVAGSLLMFSVVIGGSVVMVLARNVESILQVFSRDVTLTGRTQVWPIVLDIIQERLWLGYGYNAFWLGWEGPSAQVWIATGQPYNDSHNGWLDLWLELGLLGVAVFTFSFSLAFLRAIVWARFTKTSEGLWPLTFLTLILLAGLTETVILEQNSLTWTLYVAIVFSTTTRHDRYGKVGRVTPQSINAGSRKFRALHNQGS